MEQNKSSIIEKLSVLTDLTGRQMEARGIESHQTRPSRNAKWWQKRDGTLRWQQNYEVNERAVEFRTIGEGWRCTSSSCSSLMHKEVIASFMCGAVQRPTSQGGSPRFNGFIQTQGNLPLFLHAGPFFHSFLPPHLSISQTVIHLLPCATTSICSLLTWPFTSDPIPTVLIKTKTHYGDFLFMLVSLPKVVYVFISLSAHTNTNLGIVSRTQRICCQRGWWLYTCACVPRGFRNHPVRVQLWGVFISSGLESQWFCGSLGRKTTKGRAEKEKGS